MKCQVWYVPGLPPQWTKLIHRPSAILHLQCDLVIKGVMHTNYLWPFSLSWWRTREIIHVKMVIWNLPVITITSHGNPFHMTHPGTHFKNIWRPCVKIPFCSKLIIMKKTSQFGTYHNSWAVVPCAKLYPDLISIFHVCAIHNICFIFCFYLGAHRGWTKDIWNVILPAMLDITGKVACLHSVKLIEVATPDTANLTLYVLNSSEGT